MTTMISNAFRNTSETLQTAVSETRGFVNDVIEEFEVGRQASVSWAYRTMPENYAYIVERISQAIPEVFAAVSAVFGGVFAIPGLIVSWGRKIEPMSPLIGNLLRCEFSSSGLVAATERTMENFKNMFEEKLVPALFVACAIDTLVSFTLGYLECDFGKMLRATAIALPGAILSCTYMMRQHTPVRSDT